MQNKILVLGANGMLGHMLCRKLNERFDIAGTVRNSNPSLKKILPNSIQIIEGVDALDFQTVCDAINLVKPDIILNCTGVIKQSNAVSNISNLYIINAFFPKKLEKYASHHGIKVIHFSTDCVSA